MFRVTIRELLLVILSVALGSGWWMDHAAKVEAEEDAHFFACHIVDPPSCGVGMGACFDLAEKYGVERKPFQILDETEQARVLGGPIE